MLVDCTNCPRRGAGCDGCLVAALFEPPPEVELLDRDELWAIETLARAGFEVTLLDPLPGAAKDDQTNGDLRNGAAGVPVAEQGPPPLRLVRDRGTAA